MFGSSGSGFTVWGLGLRVLGVLGFGLYVWGLGLEV